MKNISIFGTSSDSGKSTFTFVIAKLLQNLGYKVAPFKAQNVSNNSKVSCDGYEIAIAQYFQSEVLNLEPNYLFNPVLLKIEANRKSQIIVNGQVLKTVTPREYYKEIDTLKPIVKNAFESLCKEYDIVVAEGAGSPVELNLIDKDLSNTYVASEFETKIILVADIEKGGVFASIYGTYKLLDERLQKNVIGVIINKFRGDKTLFGNGIEIIEKEFGIPVLGVVSYSSFNLGFEDSQSLVNYTQIDKNIKIKVGVIKFPKMSNFNDFEPLINDKEIGVDFISSNQNLEQYDVIILPGTKSTIEDLKWLKSTLLFDSIKNCTKTIFGICGGYEMMFNSCSDLEMIENTQAICEEGLAFIDDEIVFQNDKILKKGKYKLFGLEVEGFEIHNGISKKNQLFYEKDSISGTFVHGIFDNNNFTKKFFQKIDSSYMGYDFKEFKQKEIDKFVKEISSQIDIQRIVKSVC